MSYPSSSRLELPILQELVATGGAERVRFLYERLAGYFPQLTLVEDGAVGSFADRRWRRLVQRAGEALVERGEIERWRGRWTITAAGRRRVNEEAARFEFDNALDASSSPKRPLTHAEAQRMLMEIGVILGYHAEAEHEGYDVVWRADAASPRISHVFEVQRRGNLDSALARLKRAYDAQRSRPFLVVASERDTSSATRSLSAARHGAFREIGRATTILSFEQVRRLHCALSQVRDLLTPLFER